MDAAFLNSHRAPPTSGLLKPSHAATSSSNDDPLSYGAAYMAAYGADSYPPGSNNNYNAGAASPELARRPFSAAHPPPLQPATARPPSLQPVTAHPPAVPPIEAMAYCNHGSVVSKKGYPAVMEDYPNLRRKSRCRSSRGSLDPFNDPDRGAILTGGVVPTPQVTPHPMAMNLGRNAHRHSDGLQRHASSRIDPEQIPRPSITNMEPVQDVGGKIYDTDKYTTPPNVQNVCRILDKGSASCRFIRMTTNQVPAYSSTANVSHVVVGCVCQPFAELSPKEYDVPIIDHGEAGPLRCPRCNCYANAHFTWTLGGREAVCNFCGHYMAVPPHYLCALDEHGRRRDRGDRLEFMRGTVDYVAPAEYSDCQSTVPAILFLVDCTHSSVASHFFQHILLAIAKLPGYLQCDDTEICVVTFDTAIHFYRLADVPHAHMPAEMFIVADLDDPFAPVDASALFFNPLDAIKGPHFQTLINEKLPALFGNAKYDNHCGNAALKACINLMGARGGGNILFFVNSLPRLGVGALAHRDDMPLYTCSPRSSKEAGKVFVPQHPELFQEWAEEANRKHVGVDLFLASRPNSYVDVATMGFVPRKTGGYMNFYRNFVSEVDSEKLGYDIARSCIPRTTAFGCIFRIRSSIGLSVESCYSNFDVDEHTAHVAKMSPDTALAFTFQHDDSFESRKNVFMQTACLYTNVAGKRLIRVHTLLVQTTTSLSNTFKYTCIDTYMNIMMKRVANEVMKNEHGWKDRIQRECINVLHSYRVNCSSSTQFGQLILPESLKMLPLFVSNLYKMPCFRQQSSEIRIDQRVAELMRCLCAPVAFTQAWIYPRIYPIHNLTDKAGTSTGCEDNVYLPNKIAASPDKVTAEGAYLVENGWHIWLFLGAEASNVFLKDVFDVHEIANLSPDDLVLEPEEGHLSARIYAIVEQIRKDKCSHPWLPLKIVLPNTSEESKFYRLLVEDRYGGELSYVDYLCKIHKMVQEKLD
eukprot:GEMP01000694.1.p2 GENE.GEMP01000694.1~~GEMP01000694.1.p2  ORF type:complete len:979 (-),score=159.06 GEMP01000694.1:3379-6315(-)